MGFLICKKIFICLPMLLNLAFACCTYNQIAVEYSRIPITRVGIDSKRIKQTIHAKNALNYTNSDLSFSKEINPFSIHNIHLFLEDNYILKDQSFVNIKNSHANPNSLFLNDSSLEAEIDRNSLISLYFDTLISKTYTIRPGSPLNVTCRDYFNLDQNTELSKSFNCLGFKTKVFPESLAACIQNIEFSSTPMKNYYLNFKGSKVTGSLYEIKPDGNSVNITCIETKEIDMMSDYEFENLAASMIIDQLKENIKNDISFLPYEASNTKSHYCNIQKVVSDYIRDLKSILPVFEILEVNFYDKLTNDKTGSISDKKVKFNDFKERMSSDMKLKLEDLIKNIPEDANKFIITDIPFRSELINDFTLVYWEFIIKGAFIAHDNKYKITDSRLLSTSKSEFSPLYIMAKSEINLRSEVKNVIIPAIKETLDQYKFINEDEKSSLMDLVVNDSTKSSVKTLQEIKTMWESMQKLNIKREADNICRDEDIEKLKKAIENAKKLVKKVDVTVEKEFIQTLEETSAWLKESKSNLKVTGFLIKANRLNAYTNYITKKMDRAEEELKQKELDAIKEAAKALEETKPEITKEEQELKIEEAPEEGNENEEFSAANTDKEAQIVSDAEKTQSVVDVEVEAQNDFLEDKTTSDDFKYKNL